MAHILCFLSPSSTFLRQTVPCDQCQIANICHLHVHTNSMPKTVGYFSKFHRPCSPYYAGNCNCRNKFDESPLQRMRMCAKHKHSATKRGWARLFACHNDKCCGCCFFVIIYIVALIYLFHCFVSAACYDDALTHAAAARSARASSLIITAARTNHMRLMWSHLFAWLSFYITLIRKQVA